MNKTIAFAILVRATGKSFKHWVYLSDLTREENERIVALTSLGKHVVVDHWPATASERKEAIKKALT